MVNRSTDLHLILAAAITTGLILAVISQPFQIYHSLAQQPPPSSSQPNVAFVTDGKFSDGGWGATGYNATQVLKSKYGIQLATSDGISIPDIESTLRGYADTGYKLIIAQGFQWGDPAVKVAPDYPDVKFVI